jgi:arylsulfatase A-like enzyme
MVAVSFGADRPNIVLIMADDVGLGDIGLQHRERTGKAPLAPTPAIDALAESGLWMTDAHSPTSLCSPSRYAVMTGNYNYRSRAPWGVWGTFRPTAIKPEDATLGRVAKQAGYKTAFVGKWHLGGDFYEKNTRTVYRGDDRGDAELAVDVSQWVSSGPQDMGFDYDFTLPCGVQGPVYVAYENGIWYPFGQGSRLIHLNDKTARDPLFVSDKGHGSGDSNWDAYSLNELLVRKAAAFIGANSDTKPFFLCYWTPAVHIPHTPAKRLGDTDIRGTTVSRHLDMVRVLDWEVGQIVRALKKSGAYDTTLILFTSDNGGLWDATAEKAGHRSNGGWRGTKNRPYEGGHRVPLIASWPGVIAAGTRSDALVNGTDILATIAEITGVTLAETQAMDSHSFLPLLKKDAPYVPRKQLLQQAGSSYELMFRENGWKLIIQSNHQLDRWQPIALFNLAVNPKEIEAQNLVKHPEHQERVQAMLARYRDIRKSNQRTAP